MSNVSQHRQLLNLGAEVVLYKLDLTPIGAAEVYYFCKDYGVSFGGQLYEQVEVELTDYENNITGETSSPKISLPNATNFASALVVQYDDLVGAEVTRTKTYQKFLDGQPGADSSAIDALDLFVVEQKVGMNKIFVQWELRVLADTEDRMIPGRTCMKDLCPFAYRTWDAVNNVFVYSNRLPCPYVNTQYMFTINNVATADPSQDACDHTVAGGCTARTPGWPGGVLGFGGYPGISKYLLDNQSG